MFTSNAAAQLRPILAENETITSEIEAGRIEERLALFNRCFARQRDENSAASETELQQMTQEFAEILGFICDREHLLRAPLLIMQRHDAISCRGHAESDNFIKLFHSVPGLATAFTNLAHSLYLYQSMLEYRIFLACYREIFSRLGREAAANVSNHFEAMACPAPCLVFDGFEFAVLFGGKSSMQRMRDLNSQLSLYAHSERTVDRYFPTFLSRHLPEGWLPPARPSRSRAIRTANC